MGRSSASCSAARRLPGLGPAALCVLLGVAPAPVRGQGVLLTCAETAVVRCPGAPLSSVGAMPYTATIDEVTHVAATLPFGVRFGVLYLCDGPAVADDCASAARLSDLVLFTSGTDPVGGTVQIFSALGDAVTLPGESASM